MIEIEAKSLSPKGVKDEISDIVGNINLSGSIKESTRTLTFKALRADVDKNFKASSLNLGNMAIFYEIKAGKKFKFFEGVIWTKATKDNSVELDITCYDRAIYLNKNEAKDQVYANKSADEVARAIISDLGLVAGDLAKTGKYTYNLRGMTAYDAIMAAYTKDSEKTGKQYKLVDINGKINVFEAGKKHPVVIRELNEPVVGKLLDTSYQESLDELVNEVEAIEKEKKDTKKKASHDSKSQERFGKIQKVIKGDSSGVAGLMKGAKTEINVSCIGDWDMVAGKSIELESSIISGTFYIESDSHKINDAVHIVDLKLTSELEMDKKGEASGEPS